KSQLVLYLAIRRLPPNARAQAAQNNFDGSHCESPFLSSLQNLGDRPGESFPVRGLDAELFAPRASEVVVLGAAIVFRSAPLGLDPTLLLHSVERRVERSFFDLQNVFGQLLDPLRYFVTVERAALERPENQHRQCALNQVRFRLSHNLSPLDRTGKDRRSPLDCQGG